MSFDSNDSIGGGEHTMPDVHGYHPPETRPATREKVGLRDAFVVRATRAIEELAKSLAPAALTSAVAQPTDVAALLSALGQPAAAETGVQADPMAAARLRGIRLKRKLLEACGGVLRGEDVAKILGISRQAVDKRRRANRLLALPLEKRGYGYPAWQFQSSQTQKLVPKFLDAMREEDVWSIQSFFVQGHPGLGSQVPAEVLAEGRVDEVMRLATMMGEHGAI